MSLSRPAVRRPVALLMVVLVVLLFGTVSLNTLPVDLIPEITMPTAYVVCTYPGASPADVESLVTTVLEDALGTVPGLKDISSSSSENYGVVVTQFAYDIDMDSTMMVVREKVDSIRGDLPNGADAPVAMQTGLGDLPVCVVAVTGAYAEGLLLDVQDNIAPLFERIDGVATVEFSGGNKQEIAIDLRPESLERYGLSVSDVAAMLGAAKLNIPIGTVPYGSRRLQVSGRTRFDSLEQIRALPITTPSGGVIHLTDLADVFERDQERDSIARINGGDCVLLSIQKQQGGNSLRIGDEVAEVVASLRESSGYEVIVVNSQSKLIRESVVSVGESLAIGGLLAVGILWLILGSFKLALIIGIAIPLSIMATFMLMYFFDLSINIISLGGLVIAVGMMVDNSIVILESIFTTRNEGMSTYRAAILGTGRVGGAVMASTLTTVSVFLPIVFVSGLTKEVFTHAALSIVFALSASLVVSMTTVPCLYVILDPHPQQHENRQSRAMERISSAYGRLLDWCLRHSLTTAALAFGLLAASLLMIPMIGSEVLPALDQGQIIVTVETERGSSLEKTAERAAAVEALLVSFEDVEYCYSTIEDNRANLTASLRSDRKLGIYDVVKLVRQETALYTDCKITASAVDSLITTVVAGSDFSDFGSGGMVVQISGPDEVSARLAMESIAEMARTVTGVYSVSSTSFVGNPTADIVVDEVRAAAYGLLPASVLSQARTALNGAEVATLTKGGFDYPVVVGLPKNRVDTLADLEALPIHSPGGFDVPLREIASVSIGEGPASISRQGSRRVLTVSARADSTTQAATAADFRAKLAELELPRGIEISYEGQEMLKGEVFAGLTQAMLIALALVFMIMAAQFESIRQSLVVMVSVPLAFVGAAVAALLTGTSLNLISFIGIIMLVGVVVNNAIVLVDCVNQLRDEGRELHPALIEAGRLRLRPIVMTTITTVLGLLPMAMSLGTGTELMAPMAVVVIGGLLSSTLLTLVVIPCIYALFAKPASGHRRMQEAADEDARVPLWSSDGAD